VDNDTAVGVQPQPWGCDPDPVARATLHPHDLQDRPV